jgi:predicted membrane protein
MRKFLRPIFTVAIGLLLALLSAALTAYSASPAMPGSLSAAAFFLQPTKTPQPKDLSQVGSTDGLILMGFIIALIIIVPILLQRKSWMEPR